jgi:hypothetical protein
MKPGGSLPCLQELAIGPISQPDESSPHPPKEERNHIRANLLLVSDNVNMTLTYVNAREVGWYSETWKETR